VGARTVNDSPTGAGRAGCADQGGDFYELTLFVSGASDMSARAISNARRLCDEYLADRHQLAVVDLHEDLAALRANDVLAAPTLVRSQPLPVRRLVGDLSRLDRVLAALDLAEPPSRADG
jgi:circadian clock protein KaiB